MVVEERRDTKKKKETKAMSMPSDVKSVCERQIRCDALVGSILVVGQFCATSSPSTTSSKRRSRCLGVVVSTLTIAGDHGH